MDLGRVGGAEGGTTCYTYARLIAPAARRVRLHVGSGDSMTIWLNGREVLSRIAYRNPDRDEDEADVVLRAGANDILVRISRGIAMNGMYFRIADAR